MERQISYSLQKIPIRRSLSNPIKTPQTMSLAGRLVFPKGGDSNIFQGVGKKHFSGDQQVLKFKMAQVQPKHDFQIRKSKSVRNIMNVADIYGASPSVDPQNVRNIKRGKSFNTQSLDTLGQYQSLFKIKQLVAQKMTRSNIMAMNQYPQQRRRNNPTFMHSPICFS